MRKSSWLLVGLFLLAAESTFGLTQFTLKQSVSGTRFDWANGAVLIIR